MSYLIKMRGLLKLTLYLLSISLGAQTIPENFVRLDTMKEVKAFFPYFSGANFTGRPIEGYHAAKHYGTRTLHTQLQSVRKDLKAKGLGLVIFDAYRPQRAVDDFLRWASNPLDTAQKNTYYPEVPKSRLFKEGYIAERSGHSRGSTIDVSLYQLKTGAVLNMGTRFDYFGPESWPGSREVSAEAYKNRQLLRQVMLANGFQALATEWWHFSLAEEPHPKQYFNFLIR